MTLPDKGNFPHFLIKEIFEQPRAVLDTVLGRVSPESGTVSLEGIPRDACMELRRITVAASGTSRHAGMAGRFMIQELAGIPVEVDFASEFEYRSVPGLGELTVVITQSGETADTTAAQRKAKASGSRTLAISNVTGSTIAREADAVIYTHAGPEISIASTKAFTAQLAALYLFAVYLGETRGILPPDRARECIRQLLLIPDKAQEVLERNSQCKELARLYSKNDDFLFVGRGVHYPIAMDGALKLKEISYIHAEGYPAGEMKHGPYALIDEHLPLVALAARDRSDAQSTLLFQKTLSNLKEVKERGGRVIAVVAEGDEREVAAATEHVVTVPPAPELLLPILEIVPLQLLAYHIAVQRGCDVDQPRNLVKSVTSE